MSAIFRLYCCPHNKELEARSTVFRYEAKEVDPQKAGKELKVRAVMTGTVTQLGDSLVVAAELVNVADGSELWGQQ